MGMDIGADALRDGSTRNIATIIYVIAGKLDLSSQPTGNSGSPPKSVIAAEAF
ncbi:MAG: hypothetical protein ABSH56_33880 [Bryobacteraceae bacterium]|jgi:hypothetical protein